MCDPVERDRETERMRAGGKVDVQEKERDNTERDEKEEDEEEGNQEI